MVEQTFGLWIKQRRKLMDLTQEQLADQIGCSTQMLYKIESGDRRPSKQMAELLLSALEVEPDERTPLLRLARLPRDEQAPAGEPDGKPALPPVLFPSTLPLQLTSFVGRDDAIEQLHALLQQPDARVVTLHGPGGVGKTRLAIQVAARMLPHFAHGVYFVPLAPIRESSLLISEIARILGVKPLEGQDELTALLLHLRDRQLLLLLDNTEQIPDLAQQLLLLLSAPGLKLLVTSRIVLRLEGELAFPVPPLPAPPLPIQLSFNAILETDAVRLFVERAQAARPGYIIDQERAQVIAAICARLDGLPLAIELAAARSRILTPEMLIEQLDQRFEVLRRRAPGVPERHQTLRNTIDWSYQLLQPEEQELLCSLAIFVDGCAPEALEQVIAGSRLALLSGVESLIEQSMLLSEEDGAGGLRFRMLESIRDYALERLGGLPAAQALRARHADYYRRLALRAAPELRGAEQQRWLQRLAFEHNNLRAALSWSFEHDLPGYVELAGALSHFWFVAGHLREGRRWLDQALALREQAAPLVQATALDGAAWLAHSQADYGRAAQLYEESLAIRRALDDQPGIAMVLYQQGRLVEALCSFDEALARYGESLSMARALDQRWVAAACLNGIGWMLTQQGDYAQGLACLSESVELTRATGDSERLASVMMTLGAALLHQGQYMKAARQLEQSRLLHEQLGNRLGTAISRANLALAQLQLRQPREAACNLEASKQLYAELNDSFGVATCVINLGDVAFEEGQVERARRLYQEALRMAGALQHQHCIGICIEGLGCVAARQGRPEVAALLFGAVETLYAQINAQRDATNAPRYEAMVAVAQAQLSSASYQAAWARGRALALDQAVAAALAT